MSNTELNNGCPFCGQGKSICEPNLCDLSNRWQIWCGACGSSTGSYRTKEEAIAFWEKPRPTDKKDYQ